MTNGRADIGKRKPSLWQKIVDVALTDVSTLVKGIDEDTIAGLERVLLEADFGVDATLELVDEMERVARRGMVSTEGELREHLGRSIRTILGEAASGPAPEAAGEDGAAGGPAEAGPGASGGGSPADGRGLAALEAAPDPIRTASGRAGGPAVVLILGVNGTGKTTTAGKLSSRFGRRGAEVILAAADTFRAGAQEQGRLWADRTEARFVGGQEGGDPASVAYDAVEAAAGGGADLVLIDTAGRLHTRRNLMEELRKMDRVVGRLAEGAPHERLLVVDATSGQNVLQQAREFGRIFPLTGLVLAKFDSTGRGGAAVAVARELGLPVRYLGTGEGAGDLEIFDAERYTEELLEES